VKDEPYGIGWHTGRVFAAQLNLSPAQMQAMWQSQRLFDYHLRRIEARIAQEKEQEYGNWMPRWNNSIKAKVHSRGAHLVRRGSSRWADHPAFAGPLMLYRSGAFFCTC